MTTTKRVVDGVVVDIPDGVEYVEPEVRRIAAGVAADIRRFGHWRNGINDGHGVCVVIAPTFARATNRDDTYDHAERLSTLLCGSDVFGVLTDWNDTTETADVLARLDEGLVA